VTSASDTCELVRCWRKDGTLDVSALYKLHAWGGVNAPFYNFSWENHPPLRVRFFA
jgi:hypothetical protein